MNLVFARILACLFGVVLSTAILQAREFEDPELIPVKNPTWFIDDPFFELSDALVKGKAQGKKGLMILYSANPCSYCQKFIHKSLSDPEVAAMVQENFTAIGLDIFNDASMVTPKGREIAVKDFAKEEGVMFSPTVLFYDTDGNRTYRFTGYQAKDRFKMSLRYVIGNHFRKLSFAEYAKQQTNSTKLSESFSTTLVNDNIFSNPPHILQRNVTPASEPLLIVFEAKQCEECLEFHDKVLAFNEVRNLLEHFQVVQLDADDKLSRVILPDGTRMSPASWYQKEKFSRTPALLFITEKGEVVISTDNLVLKNRMINSLNYVTEHAYKKGWSYQRFARTKAIERNIRQAQLTK